MSHTPFLSRAFDELAKPFLKQYRGTSDDVIGDALKLDVTTVMLYAVAGLCESGATLKLNLQTSPDGVKWYSTGLDITVNSSNLISRVVAEHCGQYVRVVTQYGGTGKVQIDALALEGIPR